MQNRAAEPHRRPGLRRRVQRVVVAVQPVQMRRLGARLVLVHSIGLLALGGREVLRLGALGAAPAALADEEGGARDFGVRLAARGVDEVHLRLHDGAGLAFVVDAEDAAAQLEAAAFRGGRDGFEEGHGALAVDDAFGVQRGDAGDAGVGGRLRGVEVDYFLGGLFEGQDDGVGGEGGEVGVEFLGGVLEVICEWCVGLSAVSNCGLHRGSEARRLWLQCSWRTVARLALAS